MSGAQIDPNLRLGNADPKSRSRYPSPFFDISQQYIPPTVKELFKWVYFYVTNNSFLGPALGKISRYPVTDLIFEDPNQKVVDYWKLLMNNVIQIKTFNMEVNYDLTSYGNAFVTINYPFSRALECGSCSQRVPWKQANKTIENLVVKMKCPKCAAITKAKIIDTPFKSVENLRLVRINPEFIDIKYNDATGRHIYLYSIPDKLKRQIMSGDADIIEDTPQIYLDAIRLRRKIKLSNQNLFHLKNPTLAGKDMGWGMPRISVALKDLYYFYTLRRGQEAIINEQIVPFDILFPQANGKMDPYTHADLSSWKKQMQNELANKRRDPNYKAIMPFPVGYERIGGDGKALMLTPEMDFLAKTIIGSCGIPQEFVYGGSMQWSGSSVSLRTLENDFMHQRSQLLQLDIWIIERLRLYLGLAAPKTIRFSDFKMADDMQKMQLMINMAMNNKLPWDDILKEFGMDPQVVRKRLEEQAEFEAKINENTAVHQAEAQARAQQVMMRYQVKQQSDAAGAGMPPNVDKETARTIEAFAQRIVQQPPEIQEIALARLEALDKKFADLVAKAVENLMNGIEAVPHEDSAKPPSPEEQQMQMQQEQAAAKEKEQKAKAKEKKQDQAHKEKMQQSKQPAAQPEVKIQKAVVNMKPMPEQKPPRRQGGV